MIIDVVEEIRKKNVCIESSRFREQIISFIGVALKSLRDKVSQNRLIDTTTSHFSQIYLVNLVISYSLSWYCDPWYVAGIFFDLAVN